MPPVRGALTGTSAGHCERMPLACLCFLQPPGCPGCPGHAAAWPSALLVSLVSLVRQVDCAEYNTFAIRRNRGVF